MQIVITLLIVTIDDYAVPGRDSYLILYTCLVNHSVQGSTFLTRGAHSICMRMSVAKHAMRSL
jgi:hypothetical protein